MRIECACVSSPRRLLRLLLSRRFSLSRNNIYNFTHNFCTFLPSHRNSNALTIFLAGESLDEMSISNSRRNCNQKIDKSVILMCCFIIFRTFPRQLAPEIQMKKEETQEFVVQSNKTWGKLILTKRCKTQKCIQINSSLLSTIKYDKSSKKTQRIENVIENKNPIPK